MATQVQWRRGTTAQIAVFTPAIGEVVVDTTLHQLVVGDGVTVGGFYVAKQSGGTHWNVHGWYVGQPHADDSDD